MNNVTIVTTFRNTAKALALMWESFNLYHESVVSWIAIDDASSDGADEYASGHATTLLKNTSQVNFGQNLDRLVSYVDTEYTLMIDSDVEFLGPTLPLMFSKMNSDTFAVCDVHKTGDSVFAGYPLQGQEKIDHSLALFNTAKLKHILKYFSFEVSMCVPKKEYYDGGAMVYRAAQALGYETKVSKDIWGNAYHYGGISALFVPGIDPGALFNFQKRYDIIDQRLTKLRQGNHTTEGLTWNGSTWSCGY